MTAVRRVALGLVATLLAGCVGTQVVPSTRASDEDDGPNPGTTAPAAAGSATATQGGMDLADPGRPFTASDILSAMRTSTRPGGVADHLQSDAIASAVADELWTHDGSPWSAMAASGTCGTETCTLELAGAPPGAVGEDVWVFEVNPDAGDIEVVSADLHGLPPDLAAELDAATRAALGADLPEPDLLLTSVRWLPPPDADRFVLAYRSGDEEGSCQADVTFDAAAVRVVELEASGC